MVVACHRLTFLSQLSLPSRKNIKDWKGRKDSANSCNGWARAPSLVLQCCISKEEIAGRFLFRDAYHDRVRLRGLEVIYATILLVEKVSWGRRGALGFGVPILLRACWG